MAVNLKTAVAAGALSALLLVAPTSAAARVTVTVEFVYGGVAACGVGFFLYVSNAWEFPFADRVLQGALLEFSDSRARLGVPIPFLRLDSNSSGEQIAHDTLQLDLLRWRF